MTTIDTLVLEFGLDHRQFTREQREVLDQLAGFEREAEKVGGRAETQGRKVVDVMSSFRREALGALALFLGGRGIKEFVDHITTLDASTGKAALTMNMSVRELSAWQGAMQESGGRAESMRATMGGLTQDMNHFMLTGQGVLASVLRPLGVSLFDDNHHLKDAGALILDIVGAMDKLHMDPARRAAFLQMIPGMNEDSINLMMRSRQEIESLVEDARKLGGTTAESAAQAQEFQRQLARVERSSDSLGRAFLTQLAPSIVSAMDSITRALNKGLEPHAGKGSFMEMLLSDKKYDLSWEGVKEFGSDLRATWDYDPKKEEAKRSLAEGIQLQAAARAVNSVKSGPVGGGENWDRFLKGLSYLETTNRDVGNTTTSAQGYFQFLKGTAKTATDAGLPDPRFGSYEQQSAAARSYINKFYPDAARAIEAGDYRRASVMLKGEWPSLPGGTQPQSAERYGRFSEILQGAGRSGPSHVSTTTVGTVNVYTQATDAKGIAADIKPQLERSSFNARFNSGPE